MHSWVGSFSHALLNVKASPTRTLRKIFGEWRNKKWCCCPSMKGAEGMLFKSLYGRTRWMLVPFPGAESRSSTDTMDAYTSPQSRDACSVLQIRSVMVALSV